MLSKLEPHRALLLQAAVIIGERGLCQGHFEDPSRRVCLRRALELAAERDEKATSRDLWAAEAALETFLGMESVPWNDAPGRTIQDAIAALENAAFVAVTSGD